MTFHLIEEEAVGKLIELYDFHVKMINKTKDPVMRAFYKDMNLGINTALSVLEIQITAFKKNSDNDPLK